MVQELDAESALEWIAAQPQLPDLILLDCMMPRMSGATRHRHRTHCLTMSCSASCPSNLVADIGPPCSRFNCITMIHVLNAPHFWLVKAQCCCCMHQIL